MAFWEPMSIEELKTFSARSQSRPFVIRLADGRGLEVGHPEFLGFPREEGTFVFFPPEGGLMLVTLPQVVSLDLLPQTAAVQPE